MLKFHLMQMFLRAIGRLPLPAIQQLGSVLGDIIYYAGFRMARVTRDNINHAFPELDAAGSERLIRSSLQETGKLMLETAFAWTAPLPVCNAAIVEVDGKAFVDEQIALGRGVIFVMPHLGNWEMLNHFLGRHYKLTHMYQPNRSAQLDELVLACRRRTGTVFVEASRQGLRQQLQTLDDAGSIGLMPDQEPDVHRGDFASFFGDLCLTSTLLPRIAAKSGAVCVMASCQRLAAGRGFKVSLDPMHLASGDELTLSGMNHEIEKAVRQSPEQYLWSYKRFRTRPAGEAERYTFRDPTVLVFCTKLLLRPALRATALMPLPLLRVAGDLLGKVAYFLPNRYARQSQQNLEICGIGDTATLTRQSLIESCRALLETGYVWHSGERSFEQHCSSVEGLEHLPQEHPLPLLVLTPPLGHREVVMRFLGSRYRVTEYYHPNSITAVDDLIRQTRTAMGIALVPHTSAGVAQLKNSLARAEVVTLCPDQQPRLRTGIFVPFFGQSALTATAMSDLACTGETHVVFAAAIREPQGFRIHFSPCTIADCSRPADLLASINAQLEQIIRTHPDQYRWADKRFNIRPRGEPRLYRR